MNKLLTTPFGTFIKSFITTILALYVAELSAGAQLFQFDVIMWQKIITGALISALPVIINWLNPKYVQYGVTNSESASVGNKENIITTEQ